MRTALLALAALLAAGSGVAEHMSLTTLVAAGDDAVAADGCGGQRLALAGAKPPGEQWLMTLTVLGDGLSAGCTRSYAFAGAYHPHFESCLPQQAPFPFDVPLALCVGPAPAHIGTVRVWACAASTSPCSPEDALLRGDLLGTLRHIPL